MEVVSGTGGLAGVWGRRRGARVKGGCPACAPSHTCFAHVLPLPPSSHRGSMHAPWETPHAPVGSGSAHSTRCAAPSVCAGAPYKRVIQSVYGFMLRFTQCVCEVRPCVALWRVEKYAYADIIGRAVRAF